MTLIKNCEINLEDEEEKQCDMSVLAPFERLAQLLKSEFCAIADKDDKNKRRRK